MSEENLQLLLAIRRSGMTQIEVTKGIEGLSEARLSRILNGHSEATNDEIRDLANLLECEPLELGFIGGERGDV